ncbi:type IV secretory system conjugative DNA transfer family protein [bacterium]|nr:type IV secretory system conjugative DNA transfer family protein [bacterium]
MIYFIVLIVTLVVIAAGYLSFQKVQKLNSKSILPSNLVVLNVRVPKAIEKEEVENASTAAERMFSSLHGILNSAQKRSEEVINLEIYSSKSGISFYVVIPEGIKSFVENQIYAQYKGAQITVKEDYLSEFNLENKKSKLVNLTLSKKSFFPLKTFLEFDVDPLSSVTAALSEVKGEDKIVLQLSVLPLADSWQEEGHEYTTALKAGTLNSPGIFGIIFSALMKGFNNLLFGFSEESSKAVSGKSLSVVEEKHIQIIEEKLAKMGFDSQIKIFVSSDDDASSSSYLRSVIGSFRQYTSAQHNALIQGSLSYEDSFALDFLKSRTLISEDSYIFNTEELASIYHFPSGVVATPNIAWTNSKKGEPPLNLPIEGDVNFFGTTNFRDKEVKFGIKNNQDRMRHMYFVGKTGTGKSTVFENMIIQDIIDGRGCCYIDPHGETIEKILSRVPKDRIDDVVLIDPSNADRPPAINIMECPDPSQKNLLSSSILSAFKLQFGYSWGPRLEYLLNFALLTLTEIEGTSLLGITRLLTDKNYRKYILQKTDDPVVLRFWNEEYAELEQSFGAEAVSPIQNKVGRLLSSTTLRNIFGQRNSTIQFDEIMNEKKILLVNLSKGKIGDDNANLMGSLIVNRLTFYAMQRASLLEKDRVPFYLYVDEFQNFATESFITILSEARKYGLSLHLTHQYTAQLPEPIRDAILGNVGTMIALTLGAQDASTLAPEFMPTFDETDLISQEKYNFYCKLQIDGATSKPFSGRGLPPVYLEESNYSKEIKALSSEKYGRDKAYVQEKIKIWLNRPFDVGMAIAENYRKTANNKS